MATETEKKETEIQCPACRKAKLEKGTHNINDVELDSICCPVCGFETEAYYADKPDQLVEETAVYREELEKDIKARTEEITKSQAELARLKHCLNLIS